MRVLLDGEYFGEGGDLSVFAEVSELPIERFSFYYEDLKPLKKQEISSAARDELIQAVGADTWDGAIAIIQAKDYADRKKNLAGDPGSSGVPGVNPELDALAAMLEKWQRKFAEIAAAQTAEQVTSIQWEDV